MRIIAVITFLAAALTLKLAVDIAYFFASGDLHGADINWPAEVPSFLVGASTVVLGSYAAFQLLRLTSRGRLAAITVWGSLFVVYSLTYIRLYLESLPEPTTQSYIHFAPASVPYIVFAGTIVTLLLLPSARAACSGARPAEPAAA